MADPAVPRAVRVRSSCSALPASFPPGQFDRRPDHRSDPRIGVYAASWWAAKVRQFRRTCGPACRPGSGRHWSGLDDARPSSRCSTRCTSPTAATASTSSPRFGPMASTDPDVLLAGLLHDAGKGETGVWPRVAYALGQRLRAVDLAGRRPCCPGFGRPLERLRTHAETSAALAAAAGCSPRTVELIRHQDAPLDPEFGERSGSPTRRTDGRRDGDPGHGRRDVAHGHGAGRSGSARAADPRRRPTSRSPSSTGRWRCCSRSSRRASSTS